MYVISESTLFNVYLFTKELKRTVATGFLSVFCVVSVMPLTKWLADEVLSVISKNSPDSFRTSLIISRYYFQHTCMTKKTYIFLIIYTCLKFKFKPRVGTLIILKSNNKNIYYISGYQKNYLPHFSMWKV